MAAGIAMAAGKDYPSLTPATQPRRLLTPGIGTSQGDGNAAAPSGERVYFLGSGPPGGTGFVKSPGLKT